MRIGCNSPRELWNISPRSMWNEIRLFTFAKRIFHSVAISLARRANFVEKSTCLHKCFFLAGMARFRTWFSHLPWLSNEGGLRENLSDACIGAVLHHKVKPSQHKRAPQGCPLCWLGWPDLNWRMRESKSRALPLGDIPIDLHSIPHFVRLCQGWWEYLLLFYRTSVPLTLFPAFPPKNYSLFRAVFPLFTWQNLPLVYT